MPIRIGTVPFLNALPLTDGLADVPEVDLVHASPARIADRLHGGSLDLGLVPVVEAARLGLSAVPGPGIASRGAVRSVLLVARVPLDRVRVLALDPASRTSAALARLLLRREHGLSPRLVEGPPAGDPLPDAADAALVIGDRALALEASDHRRSTDLGGLWSERTGRPFVFAVWAGRDPELVRRVGPALLAARTRGLAQLEAIASREGPPRGLDEARALSYLREAIHYHLGPSERDALAYFLDLLRAEGLLEPEAAITFLE